MIKTIIFDIGGVVTHTDFQALYSSFALRIGIAPGLVDAYHKENMDALLLGSITLDGFWKDMKKAGGDASLDFKKIWLEESAKVRTADQELLRNISILRKNYSIGALTNLTESRLIMDEQIGLYDHFDYALLSCREHLKKPDPEFYKRALERVAVSPDEVVFIDDKEMCIIPAEDLGMKTILYTDNARFVEDMGRLGILVAGS